MHIAFYSSLVTDGAPTSGYEVANEAIVAALKAMGHRVSVIGFRLPRQRAVDLEDVHVLATVNLENAGLGLKGKALWALRALRSGLPVSASKLTIVGEDKLSRVLAELDPIDAHILNSYQMGAAFPSLLENGFGFIAHNVEHISASENARNAGGAIERLLFARDARLLKKIEARLCNKAKYVWALAQEDIDTLGIAGNQAQVLPLINPAIDPAAARAKAQDAAFDIGLIGTWSWEPNRVGLVWFLEQIVPRLPKDIKIAIAGQTPSNMDKAFPGVKFVGRVADAQRFLQSVRVVPLISRGGTGVQLKTIEAFQSGLNCVATRSSVRGVTHVPANCRVADSDAAYGAALVELIGESRAGKISRQDGARFRATQEAAMHAALEEGLLALA